MEYGMNLKEFGDWRKNVMQTVYIRNNNMDLQSVARVQKDFTDGSPRWLGKESHKKG